MPKPASIKISYPEGEARTITHDLSDYGGTSLTADSKSLVTVQFDGDTNIWIAPPNDLSRGKQVTSGKREGEFGVVWTPDNKVVYTSMASGNLDVWIMNADGTNQKQLTTDPEWDDSPVVSPDGRYVFFNSLRGKLPSVWRMDIDGGGVKQITDQEDYVQDVSRDGQWIVFASWRTGRMTLWKVGIEGGTPVQLSNLFISSATISPDGKIIACNSQDEKPNSPPKLVLLPFEGGTPLKTFDMAPTFRGKPAWTPDGKAITVYDTRTGTSNLWSQSVDGGPLKQLTDFKPDGLFARAWSRDGKLVALARGTVTSDVILISNFR
jgi:Tol biopolymer transport system component